MATPKIIADLETQLATALAIGGTSFTLSAGVDDDGVALPDGKYYFTIGNGTPNKEYVVGTLSSGTSVASVSNVTRQGTESSGVDKAHRVGASVIMTDFMTYKNYIDETTVAGASDADTNTKGVVEGATLAEVRARTATGGTGAALVITPDVADDLPTEDEKDAMTGVNNTPSSTNQFVTTDDLSDPTFKPPQVVTFTASGTWTKDADLKYVVVEVVGGGGGGFTGEDSAGGGAGGYSRKLVAASALGATETVTVGAGGAAGNPATAGGTTSFGAHCSATGGAASTGDKKPGAGGVGSGGDINMRGGAGREGIDNNSGDGSDDNGGGGNSFFGGGGTGGTSDSAGQANSGGGGAGTSAGGNGQVIVTEHYS